MVVVVAVVVVVATVAAGTYSVVDVSTGGSVVSTGSVVSITLPAAGAQAVATRARTTNPLRIGATLVARRRTAGNSDSYESLTSVRSPPSMGTSNQVASPSPSGSA